MTEKSAYVHIRIEGEIKKAFQESCKRKGQLPSIVIRQLLKDYVNEKIKLDFTE